MAFSRLTKAVAALTLVSAVRAGDWSNSTIPDNSVCASTSTCIPFTIDLTWGPTDPKNALSRNAILTNGSLPGPPLKLKVGECVDFTVINNMDKETGVHFHGIRQYGTPYSDGVPGLSQYAIQPGTTYMYQWTAEEPGTYFYHAHYKGQMMDGLYGAIVIAPADDAQTPWGMVSGSPADVKQLAAAAANLETVFIADWSQFTFDEFFAIEQAANIDDACTDAIVLNGKGSTYCPGVDFLMANAAPQTPGLLNGTTLTAKGCIPASNALIQGPQFQRNLDQIPANAYDVCTPYAGSNYTYTVDSQNGWAAMAVINSGGFLSLRITIDNHKLVIYEVNGMYIVPQTVDTINVSAGDRYSFFVKLDQPAGDYQIRVANLGLNQVVSGFGTLSYKGAQGPMGVATMNYGSQNLTNLIPFIPPLAAPVPAQYVSPTADASFVFDIMKSPSLPTNSWAWTLSGFASFDMSRDDATPPLLYQNPASVPDSELVLKTQSNKWVDLIIKIAGPLAEPHPIHKHANKFFVIGAGLGDFNFTSVAAAQAAGYQFNFDNPPYLDGFTSQPAEGSAAWMVFRYEVNTPGAWLLHCHVQTHFSGGMAVAILDAIDNFPSVPSDVGSVCPSGGKSHSGGSGSGSGSASGSGSGSWGSSTSGAPAKPTGAATVSSAVVTASATGGWGASTTAPAWPATYTGAASAVAPSTAFGLLALAVAAFSL